MIKYVSSPCLVVLSTIKCLPYFVLYKSITSDCCGHVNIFMQLGALVLKAGGTCSYKLKSLYLFWMTNNLSQMNYC